MRLPLRQNRRQLEEVPIFYWPIVTIAPKTELDIKRQAEFIDKLKAGEIWKNVIIVVRSNITYIT